MINVLEDAVRKTYAELLARETEFCACALCREDVMTLALNRARPRYVTEMSLGAAVTRLALETDSARTELTVLVYEAMRRVAAEPRHPGGRSWKDS